MGQLSTSTDISLSSSFGISISSVSTDSSQQPEHFELILHALHTYFAHVSQLITFNALTTTFPILYILLQKIKYYLLIYIIMNTLPEAIIDNIYRYKHQLEFRHVLNELTDNNDNLYFSTKKELIRYLQNNINEIEYVILKSNRRISILEYLKMICISRYRIFN